MDKYEKMLGKANERYNYSEIEKQKIISLLDYCHATDVRMTDRNMYEVFFVCISTVLKALQIVGKYGKIHIANQNPIKNLSLQRLIHIVRNKQRFLKTA